MRRFEVTVTVRVDAENADEAMNATSAAFGRGADDDGSVYDYNIQSVQPDDEEEAGGEAH